MKRSEITRETLIRREIRHDGEYTYNYDLIMKESERTSSYRLGLYTVRVKMSDNDGNCTEGEVKDAFADFGRAVLFYDKIVKNLCTPVNLSYILEDEMVR